MEPHRQTIVNTDAENLQEAARRSSSQASTTCCIYGPYTSGTAGTEPPTRTNESGLGTGGWR